MIRAADFAELAAFVAVAEERSFRRAAARLNLRPSTLSHSLRSLEERLGIRLLARTTRSVAPTTAGEALLAEVAPALRKLSNAIEATNAHRAQPHGIIRLTVPQGAAAAVLAPRLGTFVRAYPNVTLDITVDDGFVDIIRDGYDAGIRLGESVGDGMTAARVSMHRRAAVVASPGYWADHPPPATRHAARARQAPLHQPPLRCRPWSLPLNVRPGERATGDHLHQSIDHELRDLDAFSGAGRRRDCDAGGG